MTGRDHTATRWWRRELHARRRPRLLQRAALLNAVRGYFDEEGFVEVDTACLQVSPGNEAHLHAFRTELVGTDLSRATRYLHTSPEFALKKLLAAGEQRIYRLGPVFRNRERGPLHHPEFTMLEWYRAEAGQDALWSDVERLVQLSAETTGCRSMHFRQRSCDPFAACETLSVANAFERMAGIDLLATLSGDGGSASLLRAAAAVSGYSFDDSYTWGDMFSQILVDRIEPNLGIGCPTLLVDYPIEQAALARRNASDNRLAERFELYICGVEIANGFAELTDPAEQRYRLEMEMNEKLRIYGDTYPIDEDFLEALADMPEAAGCALGFDRLVMLATGAECVDDIIWTPVDV